jgi:type VI secretion system protein ImpJ
MSAPNKIIWSEGMFLHPVHFQQQDAYFEGLLQQRCNMLTSYGWGITELQIDEQMLPLGKIAIKKCAGIFPDGTCFNIPNKDAMPLCIDVPVGTENCLVYLALPFKLATTENLLADSEVKMNGRYQIDTVEIADNNASADLAIPVAIGRLSLKLLLETVDRQAFVCIGLLRILEIRFDKKLLLDEHYLPPCLAITAVAKLFSFVQELQGLLSYRGDMLSTRMSDAGTGGRSEITDFMLLQTINRYEPLLTQFLSLQKIHPEQLYQVLVQLAGEMATFTGWQRRPTPMPKYLHDNLSAIFLPVMAELRQLFSIVLEENVIALKLEEQEPNIWISVLTDKTLLENFSFILAVHSHIPSENLRVQFPAQTKVAPSEELRNLVNRALPGINLHSLAVAPRQIPYYSNFVYFSLDNQHELWQKLQQSAGLAFHVGGVFPGLRLELWALKEGAYE